MKNCRLNLLMLLSAVTVPTMSADFGRTVGASSVDKNGAATYTMRIWTPPGPRGIQPEITLDYNSNVARGDAGVGWKIGAAGSIERCEKTIRQDGSHDSILLTSADRFCLNGNRLRHTSGQYGQPNSTYQTEVAEFSLITAFGTAGNGPEYFVVKSKSGLIYEYGNTADSRIKPGNSATVLRWMLNKVRDRSGNNYLIKYMPNEGGAQAFTGFGLPASIEWTPTSPGGSTYQYKAEFEHEADGTKNSYFGFVAGQPLINKYRLKEIRIKSAGTLLRRYRATYAPGPSTGASRMTQMTECASADNSNCLLPLAFVYQSGQSGLTSGAGPIPAASSNGLVKGRYDFNGDGKDDLLYTNGTTYRVTFAANTGFSSAFNTGISGSNGFNILIDRFLPGGRDAIATSVGGVLWIYRWDDASAAFVGFNTGITKGIDTSYDFTADYDGDDLADLITNASSVLTVRRNTSSGSGNPSFSATTFTTAGLATFGASARYAYVKNYFGAGLRKADVNGDGKQDVYATILVNIYNSQGMQIGVANYNATLQGADTGFLVPGSLTSGPGIDSPTINFNNDRCTDRQAGSTIYIAACNGVAESTLTTPATPLRVLDWDGDGRTDILVNSGGNFGVYLSTGNGFVATPISTSVPSTGNYFTIDQDADGLEDLVRINSSAAAFSYWTHTPGGAVTTYAAHLPDLLKKVSDGFGAETEFNYTSTGQSNYSSGSPPSYSMQEAEPRTVVAMLRRTTGITNQDGSPNKADRTYHYTGALYDAFFHEDRGFEKIAYTDSRDATVHATTYGQYHPEQGRVVREEVNQADGKIVSSVDYHYTEAILDPSPITFRSFIYADAITSKSFEASLAGGGIKNGVQITEDITTYSNVDAANGNFGTITRSVTDLDALAPSSPTSGRVWTTTTVNTYSPDLVNWCLGIPTSVVISRASSTVPALATVSRRTDTLPNYSMCRPFRITSEPNSAKYKIVTDLEYDDDPGVAAPNFGNLTKVTVTGVTTQSGQLVNMAPRVTTTKWSTGTGQFPIEVTNAENEKMSFDYDYLRGLKTSQDDINGPPTTFEYDDFGRLVKTTRPDGTVEERDIADCSPSCPGGGKAKTDDMVKGPGGQTIARTIVILDSFERPVEQNTLTLSGTYSQVKFEYDAIGRLVKRSVPCLVGSDCGTRYWTTLSHDLLNRTTQIVQDLTAGTSTTVYEFAGRTTTLRDANGHKRVAVYDPAGNLRQIADHSGYTILMGYDAGGNRVSVTDSHVPSNTLWSATYEYPIARFATSITDNDLGTWSYLENSLGELIGWTDQKGQSFSAQYDSLSRMKRRDEPGLVSEWTWGTGTISGAASYDSGKLRKVTAGPYIEEFTYDNKGRVASQKITADNVYTYNYAYDSSGTGLLDSITYPTSSPGYRFKLKHNYQNGVLNGLSDFNTSTVLWSATAANAFGYYTQETFGNGVSSSHTYNAASGLLASADAIRAGATLQDEDYSFDAIGNLIQRQSQRGVLALSENAYYDGVGRLDYTTLSTNGSPAVVNYEADFDALGRLTRWQIDGATNNTVGYTTTNPLCTNYANQKIHAMRSVGTTGFRCYDANGNMTASGESGVISTTYSWTSFNQPLSITRGSGSNSSTFYYNHNHQRWKQAAMYSGSSEVTRYIGAFLEEVTTSTGTVFRHYIPAGSGTVIFARSSAGANSTSFVLKDHLGSPAVFTDASGNGTYVSFPSVGSFYRGDNWTGTASAAQLNVIASITRRGFTGHEMLGNVNAINMNGRSYIEGGFLSPDPFLTDPTNTQNYNRYAYVYGNPLSIIDPNGFDAGGPDYSQLDAAMEMLALQTVVVTGYRCGEQCQRVLNAFGWANLSTLLPMLVQAERAPSQGEQTSEKKAQKDDAAVQPCTYGPSKASGALTAGGYAGPGGEVTAGLDEGHTFVTARTGYGFGGGATYNPKGGIPIKPSDSNGSGSIRAATFKLNYALTIPFTSISTSLSAELGAAYSSQDGFGWVGNLDPEFGALAERGIRFGASVGAQITAYGKPSESITSKGTCRAHY